MKPKTLKEKIIKELGKGNYKIRYYKKSPYQKRRLKPEFVEEECWIYTRATSIGYVITSNSFANKKWRKDYLDMIKEETKGGV